MRIFDHVTPFVLAFALGGFALGCGSGNQSSGDHEAVNDEVISHDPASLIGSAREDYIRENITRIAEEAFPDNPGLQWNIQGFDRMYDFMYAEVAPDPDEVGYSRLKFVISFANENAPEEVGCYVLEKGAWTLLYGEDPGGLYAKNL